MFLGDYVEISTTVTDDEQAATFYETLGFRHLGYRVLTDGSINLNLAPAGVVAPLLRYAGCDVDKVTAQGVEIERDNRGLGLLTSPEGLHMMLSPYPSRLPMPAGTATSRTPISRCGMFGEYALATADLPASLAFWEQIGFTRLHESSDPYPWTMSCW
jgi:hypothetical protein